MKRRKKDIEEELDEIEEEEGGEDEGELKKEKRKEKKEKRLKRKQLDKAARWSGVITLFIILLVGILMWVSGEVSHGGQTPVRPFGEAQNQPIPTPTAVGKVIVR